MGEQKQISGHMLSLFFKSVHSDSEKEIHELYAEMIDAV